MRVCRFPTCVISVFLSIYLYLCLPPIRSPFPTGRTQLTWSPPLTTCLWKIPLCQRLPFIRFLHVFQVSDAAAAAPQAAPVLLSGSVNGGPLGTAQGEGNTTPSELFDVECFGVKTLPSCFE